LSSWRFIGVILDVREVGRKMEGSAGARRHAVTRARHRS
jgi:hypothetical protein